MIITECECVWCGNFFFFISFSEKYPSFCILLAANSFNIYAIFKWSLILRMKTIRLNEFRNCKWNIWNKWGNKLELSSSASFCAVSGYMCTAADALKICRWFPKNLCSHKPLIYKLIWLGTVSLVYLWVLYGILRKKRSGGVRKIA